ncbi:MAG: DNA mismatch repair protein MutS [Armatimonadota bacterium]
MLADKDLTPMYRQWAQAKREHPDVLLLFRMGDFYEMFGEDAEIGARELDLTLTSRKAKNDKKMPMCGVPHHALDSYLRQLVEKGYRAAICEQVQDPKEAEGLVRREVTRVVTPGTLLEDELIGTSAHNFLVSLQRTGGAYGLATVDISTGDFLVTEIDPIKAPETDDDRLPGTTPNSMDLTLAATLDELVRLQPAEVLVSETLADDGEIFAALNDAVEVPVTVAESDSSFDSPPAQLREHFGVNTLRGFGCEGFPAAVAAAAQALRYLKNTQRETMPHLTGITTYSTHDFMVIDGATRRNLELVETIRGGGRSQTLLGLLDKTKTPMGGRMLRSALLQPLLDLNEIRARHDAVENLVDDPILCDQLGQQLSEIYDLERLATRATAGTANAKDLRALAVSLQKLPQIKQELGGADAQLLHDIEDRLDPMDETCTLLHNAIVEEPPAVITEGGIIKDGYSDELDELRQAAANGRDWIANLQKTERERTGISSLKVGFNKVFGYYIEVTNANLDRVPDDYDRKQTLTNSERYITPELKEKEAKILGADERSESLEYELFVDIRDRVAQVSDRIMTTARAVAELDMLVSLALAATEYNYVKPTLDHSDTLKIIDGRHPVVEVNLRDELFVPNDTHMDCSDNQLLIVTGPNMAGKSTYLRQVALITLMAQMGSFVPARKTHIGLVDRIFTRVGASDDLATGQSTFMVEMTETANILQNATERSLVILDEIGRGTSTYDGMSLAWAVAEYLVKAIGAKTLFATHYHHLNELEELLDSVRNLRITVKEEGDEIIFLRKVMPGGTDRSYGIQVARLAGLPRSVIDRAKEVLRTLESADLGVSPSEEAVTRVAPPVQMQLFEGVRDPVVEEIKKLDLETMSPIEAMMKLKELKDQAQE